MNSNPYTLSSQSPTPLLVQQVPGAEEGGPAGSVVLATAVGIWGPAGLAAATLIAVNQPLAGFAVAGFALLVHSLIEPRAAIMALIAAVPCDWMVSVIPEVTTASKLIGLLALIVSLPKLLQGASAGRWDPNLKWMFALMGWAAFGVLLADYPKVTILGWQSLALKWGIAVLICVQLKSKGALRIALALYILGCVASAAVFIKTGNVAEAARSYKISGGGALLGTSKIDYERDMNEAARQYAIAIFACVYLFMSLRGMFRRVLLAGAVVILALGVIFNKGRAVYIALPLATLGGMMIIRGAGMARRILLGTVVGILGSAVGYAAAAFGFLGKGVEERFQSIFDEGWYAGNRVYLWKAFVRAFVHTGGIGKGLNQMELTSDALYHTAHNDWISIMGELGIIGLICFFGFHLTMLLRMWKLRDTWAMLFCLMAWLFLIVAGLTQDDWGLKYYAITVGMILAMVRNDESKRMAEPVLADVRAGATWPVQRR